MNTAGARVCWAEDDAFASSVLFVNSSTENQDFLLEPRFARACTRTPTRAQRWIHTFPSCTNSEGSRLTRRGVINERLMEKNNRCVQFKLWEISVKWHRFFMLGISYIYICICCFSQAATENSELEISIISCRTSSSTCSGLAGFLSQLDKHITSKVLGGGGGQTPGPQMAHLDTEEMLWLQSILSLKWKLYITIRFTIKRAERQFYSITE